MSILFSIQSHRAKGLLDLSHCQILDVHSSIKLVVQKLSGCLLVSSLCRPRCFVVVQSYLTELNYYYLQSDSEDTIRVSEPVR